MSLMSRTMFISGASRGIGKAIALRAARDGANIVIASKTDKPHRVLPGTIHTAAQEVIDAGGKALALQVDVRDENSVREAVERAVSEFGGIDILVNNASAISLTGTLETPMKRFDLMFSVNVRGTYVCSQACLPYLLKSDNPHILNLAPPINLDPKWFGPHTAYTMSKYGMSMCVLGMAEEFAGKVSVSALWPRTVIATAALRAIGGSFDPDNCRKPDIMADAAHVVLSNRDGRYSGQFLLDEDLLRESGVEDFGGYAVKPGQPLLPDLFL